MCANRIGTRLRSVNTPVSCNDTNPPHPPTRSSSRHLPPPPSTVSVHFLELIMICSGFQIMFPCHFLALKSKVGGVRDTHTQIGQEKENLLQHINK